MRLTRSKIDRVLRLSGIRRLRDPMAFDISRVKVDLRPLFEAYQAAWAVYYAEKVAKYGQWHRAYEDDGHATGRCAAMKMAVDFPGRIQQPVDLSDICPRCGGTGYYGPEDIDDGRCFRCKGTGKKHNN